ASRPSPGGPTSTLTPASRPSSAPTAAASRTSSTPSAGRSARPTPASSAAPAWTRSSTTGARAARRWAWPQSTSSSTTRTAVSLDMTSGHGRLPGDDAEVQTPRRVTRHGDSEYRVNGSRVRLRDVERLLGATGLTQTGYSVVAQNDVDAIIDATPAQRRSLVE